MVAPLIPIIAGAVARGAATRAGGSAVSQAAAQFGGNALARGAANRVQARENRPGFADDLGRHQWSAAATYGMMQPTLAKSASSMYSQVLQTNQFG